MKVLVIGGAGYIGRHTVKALEDSGHQILIFDNLSHGLPKGVKEDKVIKGDIRSLSDLKAAFSKTQFDAVIHFAAKIEVSEGQKDPGEFYENNVLGTINILQTMRDHKVNRIIFSSTAAVYSPDAPVPLREDSLVAPANVYGMTKRMVETILQDYHKAYGLSAIVLRYFNAAGASIDGSMGEDHEPETHAIPLLIGKAMKKEKFVINGQDYNTPDGTPVRDYIHVLDLASAHVLALEHIEFEKTFDIFNVGTGTGYSVKQVLETLEKVLGEKVTIEYGPRRPGDQEKTVASSGKIRQKLGWEPEYSDLETIISSAVDWHKKKSV